MDGDGRWGVILVIGAHGLVASGVLTFKPALIRKSAYSRRDVRARSTACKRE